MFNMKIKHIMSKSFFLFFKYNIFFEVVTKCPEIKYIILRHNLRYICCCMKRGFVFHFK